MHTLILYFHDKAQSEGRDVAGEMRWLRFVLVKMEESDLQLDFPTSKKSSAGLQGRFSGHYHDSSDQNHLQFQISLEQNFSFTTN
jgi:hypothetical protein